MALFQVVCVVVLVFIFGVSIDLGKMEPGLSTFQKLTNHIEVITQENREEKYGAFQFTRHLHS
jgi:hypothetical protein